MANEQLAKRMEELGATQNRFSFARQSFSDCVPESDTARKSFPFVVIAASMRFEPGQQSPHARRWRMA